MQQYLPYKNFKWVENLDNPNFFDVADDSPTGFILEVDLEYPQHLHDTHKDLPLCPEHMTPPGSKQKKLLTTLHDKENYVIHYRALKQALKHGMVLKKIHRALQFQQINWLKPYVDFNTEKRKQAKNEFEKMFFKLLINAVFGKTLENERKRVDVKLVYKWLGRYSAEALIARPNFHSRSIFDENLMAIQLKRTNISIRKPIYTGLSVLDISKTLIYDFHYSFMKPRLGDKCKLLYTDTDSLMYHVRGENMYELIKNNPKMFDTSDYEEGNVYNIPRVNKKVPGLMKDETNGMPILEFFGLRSKMYCVIIQDQELIKKAKGVKSRVVKNDITAENYRDCLFNQSIKTINQNTIRSRLYVVRTEKQRKVGLSPHDDKRYLLPDTTDTWPHGYWRIPKEDVSEPALNTLDPVEQHDEIMIIEDSDTLASDTLDPVEQDDEIINIEGSDTPALNTLGPVEQDNEIIIEGPSTVYKEGRASPELILLSDSDEEIAPPKKIIKLAGNNQRSFSKR